ncbi:uncharacterized protein LOC102454107 isoform X1 [Pelodiscus sinensis]|uniref:uncharacterized protein LOC102454107 isoform X1 n=1 Tax=Pelodiscus sinensis TaxID=13735 RepID=UPI003F6B992A
MKLGAGVGRTPSAVSVASCLADPAASSGKLKRSKKKMLEQKWQSLEETGSNAPQPRKHPSLIRSKTYDPSFSKEPEPEQAPGMQRAAPSCLAKHLASYQKAFKEDIPGEETLLDSVSCAWQREVPYHGRLYVSQNYVCFQCSMLRRDIKVVIPVSSITVLKKANMALVVPNALSIRTSEGEKFLFVSLRTREATYQLLRSVCKHLQDGSVSSSPLASPADTSSEQLQEKSLTSSQSDLEQSSQESDDLLDQRDGLGPRRSGEHEGEEKAMPSQGGARPGRQTKKPRSWWSYLSTLNIIILVYLLLAVALLLSSGYIGLRIVALEQQLMSMGAWPELHPQH